MSNDRALLELAANAAELDIDWNDWRDRGSHIEYRIRGTTRYWNAEHDDGDALRLAARRHIEVYWWDNCVEAGSEPHREFFADHAMDEAAAVRRAIVRAAVDLGEQP